MHFSSGSGTLYPFWIDENGKRGESKSGRGGGNPFLSGLLLWPEERGSGDVAKWGIPLSFLRKLGSISQNYKEIHGETAGKFSKALQVRRFVVW